MNTKKLIALPGNILFTALIIFIFYKPVILNPNKVLFSVHGDGIRAYYVAMYHAKHDKEWFRTQSLNYPYGENVFFTDSQPLVANVVKMLKPAVDLSNYIIGINNILMLAGIFLASLFIYLILVNLKIDPFISAVFGISIALLSPQLNRFGGHYSLSYVCTIPITIYLILLYHKKPSLVRSIVIVIVGFIFTGTHFYQFAFYAILLFFYHLNVYFKSQNYTKREFIYGAFHLLAPFIAYMIILHFTDPVDDRLSHPYGFFRSRAYPESIFLPIHKPYLRIITEIFASKHVKWEGYQYIGLVGTLFFFTLFTIFIKRLTRKNFHVFFISDKVELNFMLWAGLFAFIYSMGVPFIFGLRFLVDHLGIISQIRALGRFVWVFYFCINILALYFVYKKYKKNKNLKWTVLLGICMILPALEGYSNVNVYSKKLNNHFEYLTDYSNSLEANKIVNQIDTSKYQAVMPLPYFNVGSENIQAVPNSEVKNFSFWLSLKTGLPNIGMYAARSSISQPVYQLQLFNSPSSYPEILKKHKPDKGYLIIADTLYPHNETSREIISAANILFKTDHFSILGITFDELQNIYTSKYKNVFYEMQIQNDPLLEGNDFILIEQHGSFTFQAKKGCTLFNDTLRNHKSDTLTLSFWMKEMTTERVPQARVKIKLSDITGKTIEKKDFAFRDQVVAFNNDAGLFEYQIPKLKKYDKLILSINIENKKLRKKELHVNNLFIKYGNGDVYFNGNEYIKKNNRIYFSLTSNPSVK